MRPPSKRVAQVLEQTLDVCRELYNSALRERIDAYRLNGKSVSYQEQQKQLKEIKLIRNDVAAVYSQVLQDSLRRLSQTFDAFFRRCLKGERRAGFPRFKGKNRYNSFTYPQSGFRLEGNKLILSKIGSVRLHLSRQIEGRIKTCSIKKQVDGWFVIFTVEDNQSAYIAKTGDSIGIDVGLENFATLSTGEIIENPRYLRRASRELKIAQRKVCKKKMHGSNRRKAARILARKHQKVANQRQDFFYKLSNKLIREFDEIAVEDLNIKGLLKNHQLAKSISDAAWNTFLKILTFKAESAGRRVWKVAPQYSSQECSACGNRIRKSLSARKHRCEACGLILSRDHNAAINILGRADLLARVNVVT